MKSLRVLVVDDSAVMRKIVERSIREAGMSFGELLVAGDGWVALGVARD